LWPSQGTRQRRRVTAGRSCRVTRDFSIKMPAACLNGPWDLSQLSASVAVIRAFKYLPYITDSNQNEMCVNYSMAPLPIPWQWIPSIWSEIMRMSSTYILKRSIYSYRAKSADKNMSKLFGNYFCENSFQNSAPMSGRPRVQIPCSTCLNSR
jgi:hypothetical protein